MYIKTKVNSNSSNSLLKHLNFKDVILVAVFPSKLIMKMQSYLVKDFPPGY